MIISALHSHFSELIVTLTSRKNILSNVTPGLVATSENHLDKVEKLGKVLPWIPGEDFFMQRNNI